MTALLYVPTAEHRKHYDVLDTLIKVKDAGGITVKEAGETARSHLERHVDSGVLEVRRRLAFPDFYRPTEWGETTLQEKGFQAFARKPLPLLEPAMGVEPATY